MSPTSKLQFQELTMQTVASAVLIGTAASYLLVAWFHGSIFNGPRAYLESGWMVTSAAQRNKHRWYVTSLEFITDLLACPFCLAVHVCFWLHVIGWLSGLPGAMSGLVIGPAASAAVAVYIYPKVLSVFFD